MDLKGGTFKAAHISHIVTGSDDDCIRQCTAQPECAVWVRQPSTGLCWMGRKAGDLEFEEDSDRHCGLRCEFASVSASPTSSPSSRTAPSMTGAPTMSSSAQPTTWQPTTTSPDTTSPDTTSSDTTSPSASSTGALPIWSVMLLMGVVAVASAVSGIAGFKAYKRYKKEQKAAKQMEFTRLCDEEFKLDMAAVLVEDDAALANTTLIPVV
ncbi:hypothetical protein CYMTET_3597 [Cymbomonas tetramitiformis]|uniref:Apple domain-containing protein n=1 Tax=Cymbomonas tetramitiformis TaxID=36881 RepID=A0AAE0LKW9_9CHLO|nr:hypothetical protein CYMTET_3597 [Cymbomonas tetramitiformis]